VLAYLALVLALAVFEQFEQGPLSEMLLKQDILQKARVFPLNAIHRSVVVL